ncbi:MAG TPA: gliding motility-associated ABC transporter ATP-binding subunit GldA [Saprospiraceae bacterium]|nr:gliding motility-associated ABC transporter ATP-binding subunit GldA [Saprospiraceae bacterium]
MSISVKNISKLYGTQRAVDDISFEVRPGEILGFLGPNGAGKTTTMKMITAYLRQDSGSISVNGFDTIEQPLDVKRNIGYLPEQNPLYAELYVREYLVFVSQLFGMRNPKSRIEEMIELIGLGQEAHKKIGALSKGYRQRVGLAQALIHNPPVLILDEPTSGLDPNQLVEIRALIRTLGKSKTVIFSTHIMQEVQSVCDRVIILNKGQIVIDKPIGYLSEISTGGQSVFVQFDRRILTNTLSSLPEIATVSEMENATYRVTGKKGADIRPVLFKFAVDKSVGILEMYTEKSSVEDVFRQFTVEGR